MSGRTGGQILVDSLVAQGATLAFGVPGESYLAVLDALVDVQDVLRFVVCRNEGGAAFAAEAHGKLTGRPGIAMVTRGPGACNAAIGIHVAAQDSTPLIVLVGQVGSDFVDREAFQEIDYRRMYGSIAKWSAQIDRAERIAEYLAHAYRTAMSGRPGPVVLALPEDMLTTHAQCAIAARVEATAASVDPRNLAVVGDLIADARAPFVIVGGSRWDVDSCRLLREFITRWKLPVGCAFRHQDLFDNRDRHYAGDVGIGINPALAARVREADVLLVIGERLGEMTTSGYSLLDVPSPSQALVHVHPGPEELGRVYQPTHAVCATPGAFLDAFATLPAPSESRWAMQTIAARADYDAWRVPRPVPGAVDLWQIVQWLDAELSEDAIITGGAGNYGTWMHRLYRYRGFRTQLAPYAGAMGYGVPSAIAAKLVHPDRIVVSWNGDGCFQMNGQELATAVQYRLPIVFVVIDNGMYGTIRMHQERNYPARVSGTGIVNPDFAALARAYGAHGETVLATGQFAPAFSRARAAGIPALLHVKVDPQALTMNASLDSLRAQGEASRHQGE